MFSKSFFALPFLVASVIAQFPAIPECGTECLTTPIIASGCPITENRDPACICGNTGFQTAATVCLAGNCAPENATIAIGVVNTSCEGQPGYPLELNPFPPVPACASTCMAPPIIASGCDLADSKCICENAGFVTSVKECIPKDCTPQEVSDAYKTVNPQCAGFAGFPLADPTVAA